MPRVSRTQTDHNRVEIELAAARLFREQGIDGVSVAQLMGAAGLTHGGFYGHFESKEALAAVACATAFAQSAERMRKKIARNATPEAALSDISRNYLRKEHRDCPGTGCPASALAIDVARENADKPVRAAYADGIRQMLTTYAALAPAPTQTETQRQQAAMQRLALLAGTIILARATSGDPLSDAFLAAGLAGLQGMQQNED